jgi:hypothetical protein
MADSKFQMAITMSKQGSVKASSSNKGSGLNALRGIETHGLRYQTQAVG